MPFIRTPASAMDSYMPESAIAGPKSRDTLRHVAEVLEQLQRLSARDEFLAYLISMAKIEAQDAMKSDGLAETVIPSSKAARSLPELSAR